jgi:hypothetical protein
MRLCLLHLPHFGLVALVACSGALASEPRDASTESGSDGGCVACDGAPADDQSDGALDAPFDAGDGCGSAGYPPGPYGTTVGSTIANLSFHGWLDAAHHTSDPFVPICLGRYHADPQVKALFVNGTAMWCAMCALEEASIFPKLYASYGGRAAFLDLLLQSGSPSPATPKDLTKWVTSYSIAFDAAIDPTYTFGQFFTSLSFPLHLVVRTDTMVITWAGVGADDATLEAQLDAIVNGPQDAGGN